MPRRRNQRLIALAALASLSFATVGTAAADQDLGQRLQRQVRTDATQVFGIQQPLDQSSDRSISADEALADPTGLVTLADCRARYSNLRFYDPCRC